MSTFRFKIIDDYGTKTFYTEYVSNWDEIEQALTRSSSYRGRVREVSNTFIFVGIIKTRLIELYTTSGINTSFKMLVEKGNDNMEEFSYEPVGNPYYMTADFNSYKVTSLGVELNFTDTEFNQKIEDNQSEKLDLTLDETLDGDEITESYEDLLKTVYMHDSKLVYNSNGNAEDDDEYEIYTNYLTDETMAEGYFIKNIGGDGENAVLRNVIDYNSDENFQSVAIRAMDGLDLLPEDFFYLIADEEREISLTFDLDFYLFTEIATQDVSVTFSIFEYLYDEDSVSYDFVSRTDIYTGILTAYNEDEVRFDISTPELYNAYAELTLNASENTCYAVVCISNGFSYGILASEYSLLISSNESSDPTDANCILPHELFTRYIYLMTGVNDAFYSEYFGRTELGYDEDGEGAYLAVQDGYMIRNMPMDDYPFNNKFKTMLTDFIKLKNLIAYIEYQGDSQVFRIEKYSDIYKTTVSVDLGELVSDVELTIDSDTTWSSIIVGYEDEDPEDLNGLNIFNGEVNYSISLNGVDNELDLQLKAICASQIIEYTRRKSYEDYPDTDTSYDSSMFIVDCGLYTDDDDYDLYSKQDDDFESVGGVPNASTSYNLSLSPRRILEEWKSVIAASLTRIDGSIINTKGASDSNLYTQKTGEDEALYENSDIEISDLGTPLFLNETISIGDAIVTDEQNALINANPNKLIKFTNNGINLYGMANKYNFKAKSNTGDFELLRSNR